MHRLKLWPARILALALVGVGIVIAAKLYPQRIFAEHHPSLLETIFQSRAVVLGARILLLFVGAFIVASLFARIWGRQWLSKAGPFEVSIVPVSDLRDEARRWQAEAELGERRITDLRLALVAAEHTIEGFLSAMAEEETDEEDQ